MANEKESGLTERKSASVDIAQTTQLPDGRVFFPGAAQVDEATAKQIDAANKASEQTVAEAKGHGAKVHK